MNRNFPYFLPIIGWQSYIQSLPSSNVVSKIWEAILHVGAPTKIIFEYFALYEKILFQNNSAISRQETVKLNRLQGE